MTESQNSSKRSSRSRRNSNTRAKRPWTEQYHWLLPIGCTHSPPAIFASASHTSWLDATQAWARMALGPVLSLSWVVPSARLCNALFSGLLGFWASYFLLLS
ncbi:hypothetical protein ACP6JB_003035 [Aspergillus fumigatus]